MCIRDRFVMMFSLLLLVVIVFSDEEDGGSGGNLIYGGVSVSQELLAHKPCLLYTSFPNLVHVPEDL